MKNMKYGIIFVIELVCAILFTACPDVFSPVKSGYGKIGISLGEGEERSVLPSTVFNKYVYTFTKAGETTGVTLVPDNNGFFTLEIGSYTVEIQAYTGNAEPYTLAATGVSAQFTVSSGFNNPVEVRLTAVAVVGVGEFSYTITYPAGAMADITLQKWPGLDNITLNPITQGNGKTQTFQLDAGSYLLTVLVSKSGQYAGISEAVHINPNIATVYTKNFNDEDMTENPPLSSISGLATKLAWLQDYAKSNNNYILEVDADESIAPHTLYYSGKTNITITLRGVGANRTISLSSNGVMFTIGSGVTLVLDDNITLLGRSGNTGSLVGVSSGGTLVMNMGSVVTGNTRTSSYSNVAGAGVFVQSNGTFTMSGGTISGNTSTTSSDYRSSGGGVYVASNATFTMNSGTISGNIVGGIGISGSTKSNYALGGGVYVGENATFTMNGGQISGNNVTNSDYSYGGGVYAWGTFTMNGGTISGNTISGWNGEGGGVCVSGGTFTMRGGTIYGSDASPTTLCNTASSGAALYSGTSTAKYGDNRNILPHTDGYSTYTNNTIMPGGSGIVLSGSGTEQNPWLVSNAGEWNSARAAIIGTTGNYFIRITGNFNTSGTNDATFGYTLKGSALRVTISGDKVISLTAGSTGRLLEIGLRQTVILQDVDLQGHSSNNTFLVRVSGGSFTMQGNASVTGNTSTDSRGFGGGVYVGTGTFTMNSGEISGNTNVCGGGVYVDGIFFSTDSDTVIGTFIMNGGTITGNTGGGVYVDCGIFTKTGGTITGYASDPVNGNVVKNISNGTVVNDRGHAVYANNVNITKRKENTAGTGVNLSFNGSNGTFSGGWDY